MKSCYLEFAAEALLACRLRLQGVTRSTGSDVDLSVRLLHADRGSMNHRIDVCSSHPGCSVAYYFTFFGVWAPIVSPLSPKKYVVLPSGH